MTTWHPCTNGVIPEPIISSSGVWYPDVWAVGNPFMWAIDSVYEVPDLVPGCRYVGVTGQQFAKDGPQVALIGTNDPTGWPVGPIAVDIGEQFEAVNYRFMNPATRRIYFASNRGTATDANMGERVFEVTV